MKSTYWAANATHTTRHWRVVWNLKSSWHEFETVSLSSKDAESQWLFDQRARLRLSPLFVLPKTDYLSSFLPQAAELRLFSPLNSCSTKCVSAGNKLEWQVLLENEGYTKNRTRGLFIPVLLDHHFARNRRSNQSEDIYPIFRSVLSSAHGRMVQICLLRSQVDGETRRPIKRAQSD